MSSSNMYKQNSNITLETLFFKEFPTGLKTGCKIGFIKLCRSQKPLKRPYVISEQRFRAPRELGSRESCLLQGVSYKCFLQDNNIWRCRSKHWILSSGRSCKEGSSSSEVIPCFYGLWALASAGTPKSSQVLNQTEISVVEKNSALPRQDLESRL